MTSRSLHVIQKTDSFTLPVARSVILALKTKKTRSITYKDHSVYYEHVGCGEGVVCVADTVTRYSESMYSHCYVGLDQV